MCVKWNRLEGWYNRITSFDRWWTTIKNHRTPWLGDPIFKKMTIVPVQNKRKLQYQNKEQCNVRKKRVGWVEWGLRSPGCQHSWSISVLLHLSQLAPPSHSPPPLHFPPISAPPPTFTAPPSPPPQVLIPIHPLPPLLTPHLNDFLGQKLPIC